MFEIEEIEPGTMRLKGRLDAAQVPAAEGVLEGLTATTRLDFSGLEYISSAGLGVLLKTQQRLWESGQEIQLEGLSPHIRMVFDLAGFDSVFKLS